MSGITPEQIAAALSEYIFNLGAGDQPLLVQKNLGATFETALAPTGLTRVGDFYYDYSNGFVGAVADVGGARYVVFRGTDWAGSIQDIAKGTFSALMGWEPTASGKCDGFDATKANLPLGVGRLKGTHRVSKFPLERAAV